MTIVHRIVASAVVVAITSGVSGAMIRLGMDHVRGPTVLDLVDTMGLRVVGAIARPVTYDGRRAIQLSSASGVHGSGVALFDGIRLRDGSIDLFVAGALAAGADTSARGFVGVVFRSSADGAHFENFFLRPTNGRANDQLRRNHSVQYQSIPDYPWSRLRNETPGRYESYVDIEAGRWTEMRIVVHGTRAALFVDRATQPALIVNDLKLGANGGLVGLWIGSGTVAYFSHAVIAPRD
jgi:hypothetical protein